MKNKLLFTFILLVALFVRLWNLNSLPPGLNWDEVSVGYNAYSVLTTGKDEWGQILPLSFRAYGDYKLPAYVYVDVPFVAILGLNEWGIRLPSVLAGVGMVIFIFLILKKLTNNINISLWGAFVASVMPWSIILSRIALEANLSLFFFTSAFYFFLKGIDQKKYLLISSILFGLTIFTYNSSRIVTPLLVIFWGILFFQKLKNKFAAVSLFIFLIFFLVALPNALLQDSSARYKWTSILDQGAINRINELRGSSALPTVLASLQYNKITYAAPEIIKNYISHFDPRFLFFNGGSNYQYSIPGQGLALLVLLPLLLLGFWKIYKERLRWQLLILSWFLLAPVPAAITRDAPHALRALMMIPPLIMIITLGIFFIKRCGVYIKLILVISLLINFYLFWQNYSGEYTKNYSWSWQYGYKEVVDYIKQNSNQYEQIFITKKYGEPHEFLLFYVQYSPKKYQTDSSLARYFKSDWYWVDKFDKYRFINDWEIKENVKCTTSNVRCLLITSPNNYPEKSKLIKTINFIDGKPAFDIMELPRVQ